MITRRPDAPRRNLGVTTWKGDKVRNGDVAGAKNCLNAKEMDGLSRIVNMHLDFAEDQANRHRLVFMSDWRQKVDTRVPAVGTT